MSSYLPVYLLEPLTSVNYLQAMAMNSLPFFDTPDAMTPVPGWTISAAGQRINRRQIGPRSVEYAEREEVAGRQYYRPRIGPAVFPWPPVRPCVLGATEIEAQAWLAKHPATRLKRAKDGSRRGMASGFTLAAAREAAKLRRLTMLTPTAA